MINRTTAWYADGMGMVRETDDNRSVIRDLKSFTPGTGKPDKK